jgi:hypothetical protein
MSSKLQRLFLILVIIALLIVPLGATQAQDSSLTTCDSTLLLLVLLAERDYGYTPTMDVSGFERGQFTPLFDEMRANMGGGSMATPDASTGGSDATADPSMATADGSAGGSGGDGVTEPGPTPDTSLATSESSTSSEDATQGAMMATPDPSMATADPQLATPDASAEQIVQLVPGNVEGEDANCAALRADVEAYLFGSLATNTSAMGGMDMGLAGGDSGASGDMAMGNSMTTTLDGIQEVPGPGDPDGSGSASITINADTNEVCYDIQVSGIQLPASGAHIHVGSAGTAGDVVVPLTAPDASGVSSGCVTTDPAIIEGLTTNPVIYYVNVHTEEFPAGAVRGQLG